MARLECGHLETANCTCLDAALEAHRKSIAARAAARNEAWQPILSSRGNTVLVYGTMALIALGLIGSLFAAAGH